MTLQQSDDWAVELINVTKRYGKDTAVRDLSLRIPRGSTFGFLGPNGAGKSTTLKMIMGLMRITSGHITALGMDVNRNPEQVKTRVGYVPEQQFICRWMRIREVIRFCRSLYTTWNDELCARLQDMYQLPLEKKVKHLSKGMATKLSLLLAVAHEPDLLILDEPTGGLDPLVREEFLDGLLERTTSKPGQTVLFSSHTLADVERLADSIAVINSGQLLVHCPVDQLLERTKRIRAVLRDGLLPSQPPKGTIWQRVQRREWLLTVGDWSPELLETVQTSNAVQHIEVIDLTLEDIFKDFVKGAREAS